MNRSSKGETMNIGLIGPGEIGAVIVRKLRDAGYPVKMANSKGPDSLRKLAAETGAKPVSVEEVVQDVDVLFIVLPQKAIPELPKGLLNKAKKETIVIDVGNYYPFRKQRSCCSSDFRGRSQGERNRRSTPGSIRIRFC